MGSTTSTSLRHIRLYSKYGLYGPLWDLQPLQALPVYGTNGTTVTMASTGHYCFYSLLPFYHIFLSLLMMILPVGPCGLGTGQSLAIGGNEACRPVCEPTEGFSIEIRQKKRHTFGFDQGECHQF